MFSTTLLASAAALEAATGAALIFAPAVAVRALLGADTSMAAAAVSRVGGFGLLSLGLACWPRAEALLTPLRAMLTYNVSTTAFLAYLWLGGELVGTLLPPALGLHTVLTLLLAYAWLKAEQRSL